MASQSLIDSEETLVMAMVPVSAPHEVLQSLRPSVLYVMVSDEVAQSLDSTGIPKTATGQTWIALRESLTEAERRSTWFPPRKTVMLEVHISPTGWQQLEQQGELRAAPVEGSWRFGSNLPAVMMDKQGRLMLHCNRAALQGPIVALQDDQGQ